MKAKIKILIIFLLNISFLVFSQENYTRNIIIDIDTYKPISNVNIFNRINNTISNDDGKFIFYSNIDTIQISHIGYEKINTNFKELKKKDTIFLKQQNIILNEVEVVNKEPFIKQVYGKVNDNFPFYEYSENAFLRCIVKKNDEIIKFQDILMNIGRNSIFTNPKIKNIDYSIKILNLRKAGIIPKSKKEEDFELLSFSNLLKWYSAIFTNPKNYHYFEEKLKDSNYVKINFTKMESFKSSNSIEGYYVINKKDLSFQSVYYNTVFDDISKIEYNEKKGVKWRTIANELIVNFKKNKNKYYISDGKLKNTVEVINNNKKTIYEATYQILITQSFISKTIEPNFSSNKDIFKAEFNFDENFWKNQNQLLLNDELIKFINRLDQLKIDYDIYSNF